MDFLKGLFAVCCSLAPVMGAASESEAAKEFISSIACPTQGVTVEVYRSGCQKDERYCRIQLSLKDQKGARALGLTNKVLPVPAGKIEKETDTKWSLHPKEPPEAESISSGLANLQLRTLKLGKALGGILVDSTIVTQHSGLPETSYELFSCAKTEIKSVWSGGDNGSDALSDVVIKPDGPQDIITIRGGAFDAAGLSVAPGETAIVRWKESSKRIVVEKAKR